MRNPIYEIVYGGTPFRTDYACILLALGEEIGTVYSEGRLWRSGRLSSAKSRVVVVSCWLRGYDDM